MARFPLTDHAQQRRKQMGVSEDRILDALNHPEAVYPGSQGHPGGRTCRQKGDIVVITDDATGEVVTVLWHGKEGR
jgi:hypothetical protein